MGTGTHPSSARTDSGRARTRPSAPPGPPAKRSTRLWLAGSVLLLVSVSFAAVAVGRSADASPYQNLSTFARALAHIELSYVSAVDQDKLIYGAIRGMVRTLDPHSDYLDPEEYRVLASDTRGRFGGVGVEIDVRDGWLTVTAVFPNGPAQRTGVRVGDRFVSIDGYRARDMPIEEAVRRMRGEPGTEVRVALRRSDDQPAIETTLKREIISVDAVEGRVLEDRQVYVRLRVFQETTTRELADVLDQAVESLRNQGGVRGVLLDLRDNPGGLLDQAISVADEFLDEGVIVSTRGRDGRELSSAGARRSGTRPNWPMVVLVNGYTASAAEIVAGALRDHRRALIVGTRTFGKGSVQNVIELPDASALKLTVARYYTPSGRSIQAEGIEPDVAIEQVSAPAGGTLAGLSEASLEGHLANEGATDPASANLPRTAVRRSATGKDAPAFADDVQARFAYQTLRAITLDREHTKPVP
ncbi:MAG: Carboxyl-terminal protease [Myxococcaceae bacterium]|nr:Carboxyl-terminal protease [Myxococcaceae bacterium]